MAFHEITQSQMIQLLDPLFEYVGLDIQDASRILITASDLYIERFTAHGKVVNKISYSEEN